MLAEKSDAALSPGAKGQSSVSPCIETKRRSQRKCLKATLNVLRPVYHLDFLCIVLTYELFKIKLMVESFSEPHVVTVDYSLLSN